MATINGTFNSLIAGTLSGTVATPGATGPAGPAGPTGATGAPGAPGVGVPAGGSTGEFLQKTSGADYATGWATVNLSAYLTKAGNLSDLSDFALARDNLSLGTLNAPTFAGVTLQGSGANVANLGSTFLTLNQSGHGQFTIQPSQGIVFPDASIQTTAFITGSGLPTGGTVGQVLTKNSGSNFDASFQTLIPGDRYLTSSTTTLTINNADKTLTVGTGLSYTPQQDIVIAYDASNHMHAQVLTYNSGTGVMTVDVRSHSGSGTFSLWTVNVGGTVPMASIVWGDITGVLGNQADLASALNSKLEVSTAASTYFTIASAAGKANLSGATFTGKVITPTPTTSTPAGMNIGAMVTGNAPTSLAAGDIWISQFNFGFRTASGATKYSANLSDTNIFSAPQVIDTTNASAALRVTQKGTGDAIRVEDETTPDATRFTVDQFGKVGIGVAPDATAALKVDTNGIMFGDGTTQTTSATFTGGAITSPITYDNGSGYISTFASNSIGINEGGGSVPFKNSNFNENRFYLFDVQATMYGDVERTAEFNLSGLTGSGTGPTNYTFSTGLNGAVFSGSNYSVPSSFSYTRNGVSFQAEGQATACSFTPSGITFQDGTVQTTSASIPSGLATESWVASYYYPLSGNPSGFVDSSYVSSNFYPLSGNPSGFMSSPGSGSYVWYSGAWYSANVSSVYDQNSSSYVNVLSF
jgi:hypothetical protein